MILFPGTYYMLVEYMSCVKVADDYYVKGYLRTVCFSDMHSDFFWMMILPAFIVVSFVVPGLMWINIRKKRQMLYSMKYKIMFGVLT
jgi:hypothetical protein